MKSLASSADRAAILARLLRVPVAVRRVIGRIRWAALTAAAVSLVACAPKGGARRSTSHSAASYRPTVRNVTITTVPLLVKEQQALFPFLKSDFATGGVLDGKEVYAFSPSSVTVIEGDTIHFTFINPEDDVHSFVLPDLSVSLPAQAWTTATYVARHAGIYPFVCAIPRTSR